MPRVTRRSLASKKEEDAAQPAPSGGKRGTKKPEPVVEPEPIGEPKTSRSRGKGSSAKEEAPKGRTPSRGRGKKQEEPEEEEEEVVEEKESPPPKRGRGRGKKDDQEEKVEEAPASKRGGRGGRGKKEEEPEEEEEKVEVPASKRSGRGGRGKKEEQEEEEDLPPPPKRAARGGRGKKEEDETPSKRASSSRGGRAKKEEQEEEETVTPEKTAPKGRGRSARGARSSQPEEVEEAEEEETPEEAVPKGRQSKTPTSGGRRGRGKKEVSSPVKPQAAAAADEEESAAMDETVTEEEEASKKEEEKAAEPASPVKDVTETMDVVEPRDEDVQEQKEEMEVDKEDKPEESSPVIEEPVQEVLLGKKRKMESDEEEEKSSPKKLRMSESSSQESKAVESKDVDAGVISDFVIVNKDDVPAADSKEVEAALPPLVEEEEEEEEEEQSPSEMKSSDTIIPPDSDAAASKMAAPSNVVPLTEAELAKQYNPTIRDRDDNSSMMVEVGSEAASDVGSVSRNLDISEMTSMDQAGQDDSIASSDVSEAMAPSTKQTESTTAPSISNKTSPPPPSAAPEPTPVPPVAQSTPVVEMACIPLPSDKSSTVQQQASQPSTPVPSSPSSVAAPASVPLPKSPASAPMPAAPVPASVPLPAAPAPVPQPPAPASVPLPKSPASVPLPAAPAPVPQPPAPASNTAPAAPPAVQLNSIPMPPDYNMSNSSSDGPLSQQPLPPSTIPVPPAQNGSFKSNEQVNQSGPLHTSTPAKKPVTLDSSYVPSSPAITQRKFISNQKFPIELMDPAFCFSVVSYNILADCHLRRYNYSYTEDQYLDLMYRHSLFLKELDYLDGDIVCLQEVDTKYYSDVLMPSMTSRGYQGMFKKRTQDWYAEGEATFVKTSKFEVLSYEGMSLKDLAYEEIAAAGLSGDVARAAKKYLDRADVVLVCKLLSKRTGKHLTVGNIHVAFDPKAPDVQCIQVASAVKDLVSKAGSDLNPYIICGDFNSETTSPAYQLAKDGYLTDEHIRVLQNIQSMDNTEGTSRSIIHYLWKAFQHTSSNMKSAYETTVGREPVITSMNGLVKACLDYIFYSSSTLYTVGAMEVIDPQVIEATGGLPSKDIPSDHLSVKAVFRLKD